MIPFTPNDSDAGDRVEITMEDKRGNEITYASVPLLESNPPMVLLNEKAYRYREVDGRGIWYPVGDVFLQK